MSLGQFKVIRGTDINLQSFGLEINFNGSQCVACGDCASACPNGALKLIPWNIEVGGTIINGQDVGFSFEDCILCGDCIDACSYGVISGGYEDPGPPEPGGPDLDQYFEELGEEAWDFMKNKCDAMVPTLNNFLQADAMQWGMTVTDYIGGKLSVIEASMDAVSFGRGLAAAGWLGGLYGTYQTVYAVSDGNLTVNDLLGATGTALTLVSLIPGIGTVIGISGLVVLASGSFIIGTLNTADVGSDTIIATWGNANACN